MASIEDHMKGFMDPGKVYIYFLTKFDLLINAKYNESTYQVWQGIKIIKKVVPLYYL